MNKKGLVLIISGATLFILCIVLLGLFAPRKTTRIVKTQNIARIVAYYETREAGTVLTAEQAEEFLNSLKKSWYSPRYGGKLRCPNWPKMVIHYENGAKTEVGPIRIVHYPDGVKAGRRYRIWLRLDLEQFRPGI